MFLLLYTSLLSSNFPELRLVVALYIIQSEEPCLSARHVRRYQGALGFSVQVFKYWHVITVDF